MKNYLIYMIVCFVELGVVAYDANAEESDKIRIYLPKEKILSSKVVELGEIAIILGDDSIVSPANKMRLGQFSVNGQEIVIDRKTILSRLASSGIKASSVVFNGAETICLRRDENIIPAARFVAAASDHLRKQFSDEQVETLELIRPVKDCPLEYDTQSVSLEAALKSRPNDRFQRVQVQVMWDGVEVNSQEVVFSVHYPCTRLVAKGALSAGTVVTSENTEIEKYMSILPVDDSPPLVYGMVVRRTIADGSVITPSMVQYKESPVLIKKRQKIILKIDAGGLFVSAPGQAVEDGSIGDIIQVQRGSHQTRDLRIVFGEVMPDGTVRPVL